MKNQVRDSSILVERKYLTNDSTTTIYLLRVHKESRWIRIVRKLERQAKKAVPVICRLTVALLFAMLAAVILIPVALAERGYAAFGGEYLGIGLVFWVAFKLTKLIKK